MNKRQRTEDPPPEPRGRVVELTAGVLQTVRNFVATVRDEPNRLHRPEVAFVRAWVRGLVEEAGFLGFELPGHSGRPCLLGALPEVVLRYHLLPLLRGRDIESLRQTCTAVRESIDHHAEIRFAFHRAWSFTNVGFADGVQTAARLKRYGERGLAASIKYRLRHISPTPRAVATAVHLSRNLCLLGMLQWLRSHHGPGVISAEEQQRVVLAAATTGREDVVAWAFDTFAWEGGADGDGEARMAQRGLVKACRHGSLGVAKCLHARFPAARPDSVLLQACLAHRDVFEWLLATFEFELAGREEVRLYQEGFKQAQLEPIQWLCKVRRPPQPVAQQLFRDACAWGRRASAEWLLGEFAIKRTGLPKLFRTTLIQGNRELAQWIDSKFMFKRKVALHQEARVFRSLCSRSDVEGLVWLFKRFNLTRDDVVDWLTESLSACVEHGSEALCEWLRSTLRITPTDLQRAVIDFYQRTQSRGIGHSSKVQSVQRTLTHWGLTEAEASVAFKPPNLRAIVLTLKPEWASFAP